MENGRKLGYWESALCLLHDKLEGTGTIFNATRVKGSLELDILKKSFKLLFERHPLLRATLEKNKEGYYFNLNAKFTNIPFQIVETEDFNCWQRLVEHELRLMFPYSEYFWRITICTSHTTAQNEIIIAFHHSIADGLSCAHLVDELLKNYQYLIEKKPFSKKPLPLLNPVEMLLNRDAFPKKNLNVPQSFSLTEFDYQQYKPLGDRVTKNIYHVLSKSALNELREQCKQKHLKVNSVFNAAMLLSAQNMVKNSSNLSLITPINLRNFCEPQLSTEHFGCYISVVSTLFENITEKSNLWELAESYEKQLQEKIADLSSLPEHFDFTKSQQLSTLLDLDNAHTRKKFTAGFCVTNKGAINFSKHYGPLELEFYYTSSSRQAGDIIINLSITSLLEQTFLCFTYTDPLISTSWASQFANSFMNILLGIKNY